MSLHPEPIGEIPPETVRVACAAFPRSTVATRLRDEFGGLYRDEDFRQFYPSLGQPGLPSWRLTLVTLLQFLEHLSDRQAADAVRARIGWKYALGLGLTGPGFHLSVLTEFRARLVAGGAVSRRPHSRHPRAYEGLLSVRSQPRQLNSGSPGPPCLRRVQHPSYGVSPS
jgi:transposase